MTVLRPEFPDHGSPFSRSQERRRKEAAIITAAARRFDRLGFANTRLEDVAADLGLTKTSISYYFASKEELAEAAYRGSAMLLDDAISAAENHDGDAAERLQHVFNVYAQGLCEAVEGRRPYVAAMRDLDALPEDAGATIAAQVSACVARVNAMVAAWISERGAPLGRPEPATFLILGMLDWMCERQARHTHPSDMLADHEALNDLVSHGLSRAGAPRSAPPALAGSNAEPAEIFDREARNRMKREAFMKAGARLFNQKGFGGVSLAEVAASLGVSRGAFYYHISDKAQFLDQCLERSLEIIETTLDRAEESEPGPLAVVHIALFDLIYRQAAGLDPLLQPRLAAVLPAARQRRHAARLRNISRRLGDVLTEAAAIGQARLVDTAIVEDILASVLFLNGGYTLAAANSFTAWSVSEDPRSAAADYLHIVLYGLRGDA